MEGDTPSQVTLVIALPERDAKRVTVRNLRTNNAMNVPGKNILWQNKPLEKEYKSTPSSMIGAEFRENPQKRG
jgi:hypothetical protein